MVYKVYMYDCKNEEEQAHYDASSEEEAVFSSKSKVEEYLKKLNRDYAHTFFLYFYKKEK